MSAGGDIVTFDKPGDMYLIQSVWDDRDDGDECRPITVDEAAAAFGPNWETLNEIVRQAAAMSDKQAKQIAEVRAVGAGTTWASVYGAADVTGRAEGQSRARDAVRQVAWSCVKFNAENVVMAFSVHDLVGQHGLTQAHVDEMSGRWVEVMGDPRGVRT